MPDPDGASPAPTLSPVRDRLRAVIAARDGAAVSHERSWALHARLTALAHEEAAAADDLETIRAEDDAQLARWLAAEPTEPRPEPSAELRDAEARAALAQRSMRAASLAIDRSAAERYAATERLQRAENDIAAAIFEVVLMEADALAGQFLIELNRALRVGAELEALRIAVLDYATHKPAEVLGAAAQISDRIGAMAAHARQEACAVPNAARAGRYLEALRNNPAALFQEAEA